MQFSVVGHSFFPFFLEREITGLKKWIAGQNKKYLILFFILFNYLQGDIMGPEDTSCKQSKRKLIGGDQARRERYQEPDKELALQKNAGRQPEDALSVSALQRLPLRARKDAVLC